MTSEEKFEDFNSNRDFGQNQYASRYITGRHGCPNLGEGLRFIGNENDWLIHSEDAEIFKLRYVIYKALLKFDLVDHMSDFLDKIKLFGSSRLEPSHYDYLTYFYPIVCQILDVKDHYNGSFSSNGDKMYQYRQMWENAGIQWYHGVVCYMLMDSIYSKEVRNTRSGWVDPYKWVIDNYKSGHNLFRGMVENHI